MADSVGRWEDRYSLAPAITDREALAEWAGDRDRYLTFCVDVTQPPVHDALEPVRRVLATHDCTTVAPPDYYHITLKQVGCIRDPPERKTDITPSTAHKLRQAAQQIVSDFEPFEIEFPRLNLFEGVVFWEVANCDPLIEIHNRLCDLPAMPHWDYERADYTPHMTLSHFRSREGYKALIADLESLREVEIPSITVTTVSLQELHPARLYPSRKTIAEIEL